jgi:hypothetical protein
VTRFLANGTRHPGWLPGGHLIPAAHGDGRSRAILGDGSGNAFVVRRSISSVPLGSNLISRAGPDVSLGVAPASGHSAFDLVNDSGNPARGALAFICTLSGATSARLELYDLNGRRLRSRQLEPAPGPLRIVLARADELPSGVLFARLTQGRRAQWLRVVVAR